jgi:hypothetical protein
MRILILFILFALIAVIATSCGEKVKEKVICDNL